MSRDLTKALTLADLSKNTPDRVGKLAGNEMLIITEDESGRPVAVLIKLGEEVDERQRVVHGIQRLLEANLDGPDLVDDDDALADERALFANSMPGAWEHYIKEARPRATRNSDPKVRVYVTETPDVRFALGDKHGGIFAIIRAKRKGFRFGLKVGRANVKSTGLKPDNNWPDWVSVNCDPAGNVDLPWAKIEKLIELAYQEALSR